MKKYSIFIFVFAFFVSASYAADDVKITKPFHLTYSYHALKRLKERSISKQEVEDTVHRGFQLYDARRKSFAFVLCENNITTRIVTALDRPHIITTMRWKNEF